MNDKKVIRNPLLDDITVEYDKHGDNPKKFVIPAGEMVEIDKHYAKHVAKHLYDAVINARNLNGILLNADPEAKRKIMSEIEVDI